MALILFSTPLRRPDVRDPVEEHFSGRLPLWFQTSMVSYARKPGGTLLRKKRLIKKHNRWAQEELLRLRREFAFGETTGRTWLERVFLE